MQRTVIEMPLVGKSTGVTQSWSISVLSSITTTREKTTQPTNKGITLIHRRHKMSSSCYNSKLTRRTRQRITYSSHIPANSPGQADPETEEQWLPGERARAWQQLPVGKGFLLGEIKML